MEIGAYLCFSGILWLLALVLVAQLRRRLGIYAALGCIFPPVALLLYLFLPIWVGIYGPAGARPAPITWHTYLDRGGVIGLTLLLLYVVGAFWPIFAAWIVGRKPAQPGTPGSA